MAIRKSESSFGPLDSCYRSPCWSSDDVYLLISKAQVLRVKKSPSAYRDRLWNVLIVRADVYEMIMSIQVK